MLLHPLLLFIWYLTIVRRQGKNSAHVRNIFPPTNALILKLDEIEKPSLSRI